MGKFIRLASRRARDARYWALEARCFSGRARRFERWMQRYVVEVRKTLCFGASRVRAMRVRSLAHDDHEHYERWVHLDGGCLDFEFKVRRFRAAMEGVEVILLNEATKKALLAMIDSYLDSFPHHAYVLRRIRKHVSAGNIHEAVLLWDEIPCEALPLLGALNSAHDL